MEKSRKSSAALRNVTTASTSRSARLGLRSSEAQLAVLRRAADAAHKSLTDFILDSACLAAEQTLLDQRLFMSSSKNYQAFLDVLDRSARSNAGLKDLFSRKAPWEIAEQVAQAKPALNAGLKASRKAAAKKPATRSAAPAHARA